MTIEKNEYAHEYFKVIGEYLNPSYRLSFTIDNVNHVIVIDSVLNIPLRHATATFPLTKAFDKYRFIPNKYIVTVTKYTSDKFVSLVEHKEFNSVDELYTYLNEWRKKADLLEDEK